MNKWTLFWDMHSGGGTKEEPYDQIYIELPKETAIIYFFNRFGHNPNRVTCTCCGKDYSISESLNLEEASAYHRDCNCPNGNDYDLTSGKSMKEHCEQKNVLIIPKNKIKPEFCEGHVPEQGYVWID